jgi:hypothetical protein
MPDDTEVHEFNVTFYTDSLRDGLHELVGRVAGLGEPIRIDASVTLDTLDPTYAGGRWLIRMKGTERVHLTGGGHA